MSAHPVAASRRYECHTCGRMFTSTKRRTICRTCSRLRHATNAAVQRVCLDAAIQRPHRPPAPRWTLASTLALVETQLANASAADLGWLTVLHKALRWYARHPQQHATPDEEASA